MNAICRPSGDQLPSTNAIRPHDRDPVGSFERDRRSIWGPIRIDALLAAGNQPTLAAPVGIHHVGVDVCIDNLVGAFPAHAVERDLPRVRRPSGGPVSSRVRRQPARAASVRADDPNVVVVAKAAREGDQSSAGGMPVLGRRRRIILPAVSGQGRATAPGQHGYEEERRRRRTRPAVS